MRDVAEEYPYIAVDTEFPGVVAKPTGPFRNPKDYNYQTVKCNVDLLKVIQIGFTFADGSGRRPNVCTWQFNFTFDLVQDLYAPESIDFLRNSGLDFDRHVVQGINPEDFAEQLMSSGVVLNEDMRWISFHGSYDFGYLLKILTCQPLPEEEGSFFELLRAYFPSLYDIKFLLRATDERQVVGCSLNRVAHFLDVLRVGQEHQAGSDSFVTCLAFFKLVERFFDNQIDDSKYCGVIYGLGEGIVKGDTHPWDGRRPSESGGTPSRSPSPEETGVHGSPVNGKAMAAVQGSPVNGRMALVSVETQHQFGYMQPVPGGMPVLT